MTEQDRPAGAAVEPPPAVEPNPAARPGPSQPGGPGRRPPGSAGLGSVFVLAFLVILAPGVAVYLVTHALGLGLPPATLLGLLTVVVCLCLYPSVLIRLGWVKKRPRNRRPTGRTR